MKINFIGQKFDFVKEEVYAQCMCGCSILHIYTSGEPELQPFMMIHYYGLAEHGFVQDYDGVVDQTKMEEIAQLMRGNIDGNVVAIDLSDIKHKRAFIFARKEGAISIYCFKDDKALKKNKFYWEMVMKDEEARELGEAIYSMLAPEYKPYGDL